MSLCDVCGQDVRPEEGIRADLTIDDLTCPTPMNFHRECYERAGALWRPGADSLCVVDPEFPETLQWTPVREPAARESP